MRSFARWTAVQTVLCALGTSALAHQPVPQGPALVTFRYMTDSGERVLSEMRDFDGKGPNDATPLAGDPVIHFMNSVNNFGRRPLDLLGEDESLFTHAFFKPVQGDRKQNFFTDIKEGSDLIFEISGITFEDPVWLVRPTLMMHKLWDADQVDVLPMPYIHIHNQDFATDLFRDVEIMIARGIFHHHPFPDHRHSGLTEFGDVEITGEGTTTLGFKVTIPYAILKNFEEQGQTVPPGLPAPFGFLEPWHFHFEYVLVGHEPPVNCGEIQKFTAKCKDGGSLLVGKARTVAAKDTWITMSFNGTWMVGVVRNTSIAKAKRENPAAGTYQARIEECQEFFKSTTTCP